jgi:hypothetical protein
MVKIISKDISKSERLTSILILNYNGLKYVDKCIASILRTNHSSRTLEAKMVNLNETYKAGFHGFK